MKNLEKIIETIKAVESKKREIGAYLRNTNYFVTSDKFVLENSIFLKSEIDPLINKTICGVDGGLVKQELHGIDLILTRAVASFFLFHGGKLESAEYLPSKTPLLEIDTYYSLDRYEFEIISSLLRAKKEVSVAINAIDKNPDIILMDGSIVPHPMDKPPKDSKAVEHYEELIFLYKKLYEKAIENNVLLAGVVEDSRSKNFCNILEERIFLNGKYHEIISRSADTNLLQYILKTGERSFVFKYCKNANEHPTLKNIELGNQIYSFYLKTVKEDNPVRIDFLSGKDPVKTAEKISSIIYPISAINSTYGIPSVLIEADQRAKLSSQDLDLIKRTIINKVGPFSGIQELRRNRRPFK